MYDQSEWNDTDSDGIGDNSDDDIDGDGVLNDKDVYPYDNTKSAVETKSADEENKFGLSSVVIIIIVIILINNFGIFIILRKGFIPLKKSKEKQESTVEPNEIVTDLKTLNQYNSDESSIVQEKQSETLQEKQSETPQSPNNNH